MKKCDNYLEKYRKHDPERFTGTILEDYRTTGDLAAKIDIGLLDYRYALELRHIDSFQIERIEKRFGFAAREARPRKQMVIVSLILIF